MRVNKKDYTKEEIRKIISESLSKTDCAKAFGFTYGGGRASKIIDNIIKDEYLKNNGVDYLSSKMAQSRSKV